MNGLNSRREGFALAAAVLAMLVVGAIVTGGFYAAAQQGSISKNTDAGKMAFYIAESGMNAVTTSANISTLSSIPVSSSTNSTAATAVAYNGSSVGEYTWKITHVGRSLYLISTTGKVTISGPYSGAQRTITSLARLRKADFDNNTAIQVYGDLSVSGSSVVSGTDYTDPAWTICPLVTDPTYAVTANPTSAITVTGSGTITPTGSVRTQLMDSASFNVFGEVGFDEIAAFANYTFPTTVTVGPQPYYSGGQCDPNVSGQDNWGAPSNPLDPCYNWFPIIYAHQSLRISSSGTGQGILLVEGDLEISGGFTFYGVVVVRGSINMTGTGGHVNGTLITYGSGNLGTTSTTLGNSVVQYSSCAIERAVLGNPMLARVTPIANRSWMDMSNVVNSY